MSRKYSLATPFWAALFTGVLLFAGVGLTGCEADNGNDIGEEMEDVGDEVGDAIEDAGDEIEEAADDATE